MIPNSETSADLKTPEGRLAAEWVKFHARWSKRNQRHLLADKVVRGDWSVFGPDDEQLTSRSPNLVQVALEDTAEAASLVPSARMRPSDPGKERARRDAAKMEMIAAGYMDRSKASLLTINSNLHLAGLGLHAWVVRPPSADGAPIQLRDARTVYPEYDWTSITGTKRAFIAQDVFVTQLPEEYRSKFLTTWLAHGKNTADLRDLKVTLLEYYDHKCITTACVASTAEVWDPTQTDTDRPTSFPNFSSSITVIFETIEHELNACPVVIGQRPTFDGEPRGQFDQVIPVMQAHVRLAALSLDYADQAVYSDIWVKDLIGPLSTGGGGYIQLGPQGEIGRVPPAVTGYSVYQELQQLVDGFHLGARWPKVRPGEVDQAIASAKFVEATAGVMNTVIRTYHQVMKNSWEVALALAFKWDKLTGKGKRVAQGILRNQSFNIEYDSDDIDLGAQVRVEYGLGLGRDPAQSMVLGIQAQGAGFVSREFVQDNFEGITDVAFERVRIDMQQLQDMLMAKLLQGIQEGGYPDRVLLDVAKARQKGDDLFDIFEKYVIEPQEEAQANMMTSGLTGAPMAPGPDPNAPQGAPPPPDMAGLLASLGGAPPESIGRLSVPLPGGGFAGTQSTGGGSPSGY